MNFTQDIRILNFSEHAAIDEVLNPVVILLCVYVMALVSSLLLGPQVSFSGKKRIINLDKYLWK